MLIGRFRYGERNGADRRGILLALRLDNRGTDGQQPEQHRPVQAEFLLPRGQREPHPVPPGHLQVHACLYLTCLYLYISS